MNLSRVSLSAGRTTKFITPKVAVAPVDFFDQLKKKFRQRNQRISRKLLAWGELLDEAGWCVALALNRDHFWLGKMARQDLQKRKSFPTNWLQLREIAGAFSEESIRLQNESVLIWSESARAEKRTALSTGLTPRETEVWNWLREGKTSLEIALILGCAIRTVEKHVANLYRKIGVRNRTEAILNVGDKE